MQIPDTKSNHIGKKIERIRELRGIKQETLAEGLGISQQAVSKMEQSKEVDDKKLKRVADILGVTADTIKSFNEDAAIYNIQNNYDSANVTANNIYQTNSLDKVVELYERLLSIERNKVEALEKKLKLNATKK